jgi:hypothetical protein
MAGGMGFAFPERIFPELSLPARSIRTRNGFSGMSTTRTSRGDPLLRCPIAACLRRIAKVAIFSFETCKHMLMESRRDGFAGVAPCGYHTLLCEPLRVPGFVHARLAVGTGATQRRHRHITKWPGNLVSSALEALMQGAPRYLAKES